MGCLVWAWEFQWECPPSSNLFLYSVQITLNPLTNDPIGPLTAEAKVVRRGRMTVVDTTVTASTGETAALMRSTHMMVDLKKKGPHKKREVP